MDKTNEEIYSKIIESIIKPLDRQDINFGMIEHNWNKFEENIHDALVKYPEIEYFITKVINMIESDYKYEFMCTGLLGEVRAKICEMWKYYVYQGGIRKMGVNIKDNTSEGAAFESAMNLSRGFEYRTTDEWEKYLKSITPDPEKAKEEKAIERPSKTEYYLGIAKAVSARGTCLRRKFGAIVVKDDRVVSTGYVGAPKGRKNCCDLKKCFRMENNIPSGQRYELCRSVHAEMNAIIQASKEELEGGVMYLVGIEPDGSYTPNADCCSMCKRVIINAGIRFVVIAADKGQRVVDVNDWVTHDDSLTLHEGY